MRRTGGLIRRGHRLRSLGQAQGQQQDEDGGAGEGDQQRRSDDFIALARLPQVEKTLLRVQELDMQYEQARVEQYLGILNTIRPPALGGDFDSGLAHFEKAINTLSLVNQPLNSEALLICMLNGSKNISFITTASFFVIPLG